MDCNSSTFCVAPWFFIRNTQQSEYRVCCYIEPNESKFAGRKEFTFPQHSPEDYLNSEYATYLRQNLVEGNRLPECRRCWEKEQTNGTSFRQGLLDTITQNQSADLDKTWLGIYFKHKKDFKHDLLYGADVKLTNVCNFQCAMCDPSDSSQIYSSWIRDQDHPWIKTQMEKDPGFIPLVRETYKNRTNHDLLIQLLQKKPKYIKLLGGEPLLDAKMFSILDQVPIEQKQKTNLLFVTNGSVDLLDTKSRLRDFRDVHFVVSLESIGPVQDYVRRGSDWSQIEANIDRWLRNMSSANLAVHATAQALTVLHLPRLIEWCRQKQIYLEIDILDNPVHMNLSAIPDELKNTILAYINTKENCASTAFIAQSLIQCQHDDDTTKSLSQFLEWYDPSGEWKKLFPEWIDYL